jgi:hypothetical protein
MDDNKIQDFLIQLMQDMSYIKAKLEAIDEQKLNSRIDALEAQNKEHDRVIKSLENRNSTMEQFVRNSMTDTKKQQTSVFISMGMAVFSAIVSVVITLLF